MPAITLIHVVETCIAAPNQWNAWDTDGNYWYLHFRAGLGTISKSYDIRTAAEEFFEPGLIAVTLEEMLSYLDVGWAPEQYHEGQHLQIIPHFGNE